MQDSASLFRLFEIPVLLIINTDWGETVFVSELLSLKYCIKTKGFIYFHGKGRSCILRISESLSAVLEK